MEVNNRQFPRLKLRKSYKNQSDFSADTTQQVAIFNVIYFIRIFKNYWTKLCWNSWKLLW